MDGRELNRGELETVDRLLARICEGLRDEAEDKLRSLGELDPSGAGDQNENTGEGKAEKISHGAKSSLELRWLQIRSVAGQMMEDLSVK